MAYSKTTWQNGTTPINETNLNKIESGIENLDKNLGTNTQAVYDNTATYAVGNVIIYNNLLYKCITAVETAEDFDSTKWAQINILDIIEDSIELHSNNIVYPTLSNGENYDAYGNTFYYKKGNSIRVHIGVKITSTSTVTIFTLPEGFRPKYPIYIPGIGGSLTNSYTTMLIQTNGNVRVNTQNGYAGGDISFDIFDD